MAAKSKTTTTTKTTKPASKVTQATSRDDGTPDYENEDLDAVNTDFPLLREDSYLCEFVSYEKQQSRDGSKTMGHFTFRTAEQARDTQGNPVAAGYSLHKRVNLTESNDESRPRTPDQIRKELAMIVKAFGAKKVADLRPGDRLLVRTRNSKERTDPVTGTVYTPATEPARFLPAK